MFIVTRRKKQKTWHEKSIFIFLPVFQEVFCPLVEIKVFFVELDTLCRETTRQYVPCHTPPNTIILPEVHSADFSWSSTISSATVVSGQNKANMNRISKF